MPGAAARLGGARQASRSGDKQAESIRPDPRPHRALQVPALCADGVRYRPFPWREFMAARAYDNFTDLGADDTQVTDYRIPTA